MSAHPILAAHLAIIQHGFQDSNASRLPQLQSWHAEYTAAPQTSRLLDPVVQVVQSDELSDMATEQCVEELGKGIQVTGRFCTDCAHLFANYPDLSAPGIKDPSTKRCWPGSGADWAHVVVREVHTLVLEAMARNGCRFCGFLLQSLRDADVFDVFRKIEARLAGLGSAQTASLSVQNWGTNASQLLWVNLPGKVSTHCNYGIAVETKLESAALEEGAETYEVQRDVLDTTKTWMEECDAQHQACKQTIQGPLPTRLLSIAADIPRVVLTAGWPTTPRPRYSTLSHRWGADDFLQLTAQNNDAFLSGIPLADLPKTFTDAILISRHLGLEYIWIDSLCIMQGNTLDWRRESSAMNTIYGNSAINIAASSATDVHQGCFLKPPQMLDGLRTTVTIANTSSRLVREFRSSAVYDLSTTSSYLATRAWALQERVLPSRTAHFGRRGAFWECKSTTANDALPNGFPKQLGNGLLNSRVRTQYFAGWWADIVRLYSAASLTFARDKLPALSGIARAVHAERGGTYLAGIWQDEDMPAQLCWGVSTPQPRVVARAPSWSWASVDGGVAYRERQERILPTTYARVLDAQTRLLGADEFSEVRGGSLRLACVGLLAATVVDANSVSFADGVSSTVAPDYHGALEAGATVYLLPLIGGRSGMSSFDRNDVGGSRVHEFFVSGLVLQRSNDTPGEFRRVASFRFHNHATRFHDEKVQDGYHEFVEALEQRGGHGAQSVGVDVVAEGAERYVVCIV